MLKLLGDQRVNNISKIDDTLDKKDLVDIREAIINGCRICLSEISSLTYEDNATKGCYLRKCCKSEIEKICNIKDAKMVFRKNGNSFVIGLGGIITSFKRNNGYLKEGADCLQKTSLEKSIETQPELFYEICTGEKLKKSEFKYLFLINIPLSVNFINKEILYDEIDDYIDRYLQINLVKLCNAHVVSYYEIPSYREKISEITTIDDNYEPKDKESKVFIPQRKKDIIKYDINK
jgi:hypothetical protein